MESEANFVLSEAEAARTVAVPPVGIAAGALYVVGLPLAACTGSNEPQPLALSHVTDQFTPEFEGSFETTALSLAVLFTCKDEGGAVRRETEIAGGGCGVLFPVGQPVRKKLKASAAVKRHTVMDP